ncbi:sensor histidine kinase [Actinokineospora xionganensis]|uniref:histidine kinase n=1 Tax=Actinokineospora xionganensis TaxID=2684470 RepID=A0ABR7L5S5_9PSEU|nr:histidine kinase [Actinokineospora xionganensis]MBC6448025.1 two-component sensor histidine kinase [Actinokineospora xionganensis]
MRDVLGRWRLPAVVGELLLVACVAAVTAYLADVLPVWGWPGVVFATGPVLTAVVALTAVVVLLRRWSAWVALLGAAVLFGVFPATGVALAVVAHTAGGRCGPPLRGPLFGVAALLPLGVVLITQPAYRWQYVTIVITTLTVLCLAVPALVGALQAQQARLVAALRERAEFLARTRDLERSEARQRERSRIAEETHDHLGHRLSLIAMYSGALEVAATDQDPELVKAAHLVRSTARTALNELRQSLGVLRPAGQQAESTEATGTRADVTGLVEASRAAGVSVSLDWRGPDLTDARVPVRQAVHRVVREALTNVHKHAAGAPVTVTVESGPERLVVEVGNGPDGVPRLAGTGSGLVGLRERVRLVAGGLTAGPTADGGFAVTAVIPLTGEGPVAEAEADERAAGAIPTPRRTVRLAAALLPVAGLAAVAAMVLTTLAFVPPPAPADHEDPLEDIKLGMTPEDVEGWFGPNIVSAEAAALDHEPPWPDDTWCSYVPADDPPDAKTAAIFRFCFAEDELVEKTWFEIPVYED